MFLSSFCCFCFVVIVVVARARALVCVCIDLYIVSDGLGIMASTEEVLKPVYEDEKHLTL